MDQKQKQEPQLRINRLKSNQTQNIVATQPTRYSFQKNGMIRAYAANTNQGAYRNYNEDRVTIILNINQPSNKQLNKTTKWPSINYFGVFDGHGGNSCADFLRDNLHDFIINDHYFPYDVEKSIINGFKYCESRFIELAISSEKLERSGSCANVCLFVDSLCYIANVGDSRSILSRQRGTVIHNLSVDHKPDCSSEQARITANGGKVYQTQVDGVLGPKRVFPGRLSVSRAFGDVDAKLEHFGGKQGVVIAEPDITIINVNPQKDDFIIIGCDGIFDNLTTEQIVQHAWNTDFQQHVQANDNLHKINRDIVEAVIQKAIDANSMDNLTVVMISLPNFSKYINSLILKNELDTQNKNKENHKQINQYPTFSQEFQSILKSENAVKCKEDIYKILSNYKKMVDSQKNQNNGQSQNRNSDSDISKLNFSRNQSANNPSLNSKFKGYQQKQDKQISSKSQQNKNRIVFKNTEVTQNNENIQEPFNKYSLKQQFQRLYLNNVEDENDKENMDSNRFNNSYNEFFKENQSKQSLKNNMNLKLNKTQTQSYNQTDDNKHQKGVNIRMMNSQESIYGNLKKRIL